MLKSIKHEKKIINLNTEISTALVQHVTCGETITHWWNGFSLDTHRNWKNLKPPELISATGQSRANTETFPATLLPCAGLNFLREHQYCRAAICPKDSSAKGYFCNQTWQPCALSQTLKMMSGRGMKVSYQLLSPHRYYVRLLLRALEGQSREYLLWCYPSEKRYFTSGLD